MANKHIDLPLIDDKQLEQLAGLNASYEEMAKFFRTTPTWLHNNKKEIIDRGVADTKIKLRRAQLKIALDETHKNQHVMLIFLGKALLGQRETTEVINHTVDNTPKTLIELYKELNEAQQNDK